MSPFSLIATNNNNKKQKSNSIFSYVEPTESITISVLKNSTNVNEYNYKMDDQFKDENLLIQLSNSVNSLMVSKSFYKSKLSVHIESNYGTLTVFTKKGKNFFINVPKAYVKVYFQSSINANVVKFYKDGYTDFNGKFDYVSVSSTHANLNNIDKFAIFVTHPQYGSIVTQADKPTS